jgi:hypothetical protein
MTMTKNQQYLLIGGLGLGALGFWWWWSTQQATAAAQITAQPPIPGSNLPPSTAPVTTLVSSGNANIPPVGTTATASGVDMTQLNALLAWANTTQNPTLYIEMMNQLTAAQVDSLYGILTTEWTTGAEPTNVQTAFWNQLRDQFPFLNTGGKGCTSLACN